MTETAAVDPAVWLVDKPAGPTSHDIVAAVRRRLGRGVKVGHCGTLDPFATGVLVVVVGRATRLAPYLSSLEKTYLAAVRTGFTSVTGDPEGPITESGRPATASEVEEVLPGFLGIQAQRVPAYAAVRVDGERLHRRARRGETVEAPERTITISALRLVRDLGGGTMEIEVRCGAGTYVRQLAGDIGERLGTGAYCAALRRTAVGRLSLDDAVPPDAVGPTGGLNPLAALSHLPVRELSSSEVSVVANGRPVPGEEEPEIPVALAADGRLVAVARADGAGELRPVVVLEDPR
jgi:tRNA pseudouridine55 synthase